MEYPAVDMPSEVTYVLITYVVLHVVVHMVLTIQRFYLERMAVGSPNKGELLRFDFNAYFFFKSHIPMSDYTDFISIDI